MILKHTLGHSLELQNAQNEEPLWRYIYSGKPKPFFHPLRTLAGHCVSLFEPHDHVWHRGLWFTIKYLNGENFWEEGASDEEHGTQQTTLPPTVSHLEDGSILWYCSIEWQRPQGAGSVFHEARRLRHLPVSAQAYALDWDVTLTAQHDVLLDRTPFTTWGGYGGLTLRGNRNWQKTQLLFPDGSTSDRPIGLPAQWCDLSGTFDGGREQTGGVAMFDHPGNLRSPSPWYGATGAGHYFNAAFLFHEPLQVSEGEVLRFRYRVLVHDGLWSVEQLQAAYADYLGENQESA